MDIEMAESSKETMGAHSVDLTKVCRTCLKSKKNLIKLSDLDDGNFLDNYLFTTFKIAKVRI